MPAPAQAGPAAKPEVAHPNALPAPTALLTGAAVTFTTTTDNKDHDSIWQFSIDTNKDTRAAFTFGEEPEFTDGSVHGPFPLTVNPGVATGDINPGSVFVFLDPNGNDTWRFNYTLTMTFSDGGSAIFRDNNKQLSESSQSFESPFALTAPVTVPNLRGDAPAEAGADLRAAGLMLGTTSSRVDTSCDNIGRVLSESPVAGTVVGAGTAVNITLGQRPSGGCP